MVSRRRIVCIPAVALLVCVSNVANGSFPNGARESSNAITIGDDKDGVSPLPDFDGDGTVGLGDFVIFAASFGLRQSDDGYDARVDLNDDGEIGFADLLIFAENFGKQIKFVSLEVFGVTVLTAIGQTADRMVTASRSDDSRQDVQRALVEWTSSDVAVAAVSEGVVTAVAGGNAVITASVLSQK